MSVLNPKFIIDFLELLADYEVVDSKTIDEAKNKLIKNDIDVRNYFIKKEYAELTDEGNPNKVSCEKARMLLAEKYFRAEKSIQRVLYNL